MVLSPPPADDAGSSPTRQEIRTPLSAPSRPRRPLQREGACFFTLTSAEQALADAMLRSSPPPEPVIGKRARQGDDSEDGNNTEPDEGAPLTGQHQPGTPTISNVTVACQRYAVKKKLRPEQRDELDAFLLSDSALGRQGRLFTMLLSLENKIDAQQSAAPPYTLSEDLKTNINNYGLAVMLSVNISAYKGSVPVNHVLDILKRHRFDLPPGIEHDYANWEKITGFVSYSLTQARSKVKKQIKTGIDNNTNIFALAQIILHGTPCRPTVQLCARIALMRAVYLESEGDEKYWDNVDKRLKFIRDKAKSSASRMARAFTSLLKQDRKMYGVDDNYEIKDIVADEWQQRVDDVVAGAADLVAGMTEAVTGATEGS